jgi:RNA polymerase sigma factor (sigma-70 family)
MNDAELLRLYVCGGSESAFSELVARHLPLVYAAALRQMDGDADLARDVAQTVFIDLARKARSLSCHPVLAGWLHTSTRFAAANLRRAEQRRSARERLAIAMQDHTSAAPESEWSQLAPVLDEAIGELNEEDRAAVLLRYFENQNLKAIGSTLGISEDAARMRVNRALAKLHSLLSARGVKLGAASLGAVLAAQPVVAVPAGLAAVIAGNTFTALAAAGSGGWLAAVLQAAKLKWASTAISGAALVVAILVGIHFATRTPPSASVQALQPSADSAQTSPGLAGTTPIATEPPAQVEPRKTRPAAGEMLLLLLDALTEAPLPDGKVYVAYFGEGGMSKSARLTSDADGNAFVEVPRAPFNGANIFVTTDAHVPIVVSYDENMVPDYTLKIERGTPIGGFILNEEGRPVSGVSIEFGGPGIDTDKKVNVQFGPDTKQTSGPTGHWFCNMIPSHLESILLVLIHPDYAPTGIFAPANKPAATNAILIIKRGVTVSGLVRDTAGRLIQAAKVREVQDSGGPRLAAATDRFGRFELRHVPAGELMLAVQAEKFAPTVLVTNIGASNLEVNLVLEPGRIFRGHLVDEQGAPITNAVVKTDWDNQGLRKIEWSTRTDAEGRFAWDSAPAEPLLYWFEAPGFEWIRGLLLAADGSDHELKLARKGGATERPDSITGTVIDAETGTPLDPFRVLLGDVRQPDGDIEFRLATEGRNGLFSVPLRGRVFPTFQIQIQKDGYLPVASASLAASAGSQHLHFELRKGDGPSGIVLLPSGEPAAQATVFLCEARGGVYMDQPGQYRKEAGVTSAARAETDATGRFNFEPKLQTRGFIALHEQGYVDVPVQQYNGTIQLQPWGRVEGTLELGEASRANRRIILGNLSYRYGESGRQFPALMLWLEAITDDDGNFTFEKVPPGERRIAMRVNTPPGSGRIYDSYGQTIQVAPGAATRVTLGDGGATVRGRLICPSETNGLNWRGVVVELTTREPDNSGPRPKREDFASNDAFIAALRAYAAADRAFWTSEFGRQFERRRQQFTAICEPDGSFAIPGVLPGNYLLKVEVRGKPTVGVGPSRGIGAFDAVVIASLAVEVTVPEPADGDDSTVDLGTVALKPAQDTARGR